MVNTQQKNKDEHKDAVSLIAAGAVIGAGVAVAATLALKNEKNQQNDSPLPTPQAKYDCPYQYGCQCAAGAQAVCPVSCERYDDG